MIVLPSFFHDLSISERHLIALWSKFEEGSSSTLKDAEEVKIGGREALKNEYRYGSGNGDLYGYRYIINIDDIYPRGYMSISFVTADGTTESAETTFADAEVQAMINSIVINGLEE